MFIYIYLDAISYHINGIYVKRNSIRLNLLCVERLHNENIIWNFPLSLADYLQLPRLNIHIIFCFVEVAAVA